MSINNFPSENISVYPSALRQLYPDGKFTSEKNITDVYNTITGRDSYIITKEINGETVCKEIVIHGYHFTLKNGDNSSNDYTFDITSGNKIAYIVLDKSGRLVSTSGSTDLDTDSSSGTSIFTGLEITDDPESIGLLTDDEYGEIETSYGKICFLRLKLSNRIRFNGDSVGLNGIKFDTVQPTNSMTSTVGTNNNKFKAVYATELHGNLYPSNIAPLTVDDNKVEIQLVKTSGTNSKLDSGAKITISSTEPTNPSNGDIWFLI